MYRTLDFIFALVGLIISSPILFVIILLSLFDTGSPVFLQKRVGRNQKPFVLIKFRTMPIDTASVATHLATPSKVTSIGTFLRKSKLDELPQLINVLRGEMSLVGPRPCLQNQYELINAREKREVFSVRPGITGLAQVNGIDMSQPELLSKTDQIMINTYSLKNYFLYLKMTVVGNGYGDNTE